MKMKTQPTQIYRTQDTLKMKKLIIALNSYIKKFERCQINNDAAVILGETRNNLHPKKSMGRDNGIQG